MAENKDVAKNATKKDASELEKLEGDMVLIRERANRLHAALIGLVSSLQTNPVPYEDPVKEATAFDTRIGVLRAEHGDIGQILDNSITICAELKNIIG